MSKYSNWGRGWLVLIVGLVWLVGCSAPAAEPVATDEPVAVDGVDSAAVPDEPVVAVAVTCSGEEMTGERPLAAMAPVERNEYFKEVPPLDVIDPQKSYYALFETTHGNMCIQLFAAEAPVTVNNFVFLANQGFYDGTTFHRVLANFMAQGGDPSGTGRGGPGYAFIDETNNGKQFDKRGILAMANAGPNTNGSQFFITFVPTQHLTGRHTIFGELIDGDDTLGAITLRDPQTGTAPGDTLETVRIFVQ